MGSPGEAGTAEMMNQQRSHQLHQEMPNRVDAAKATNVIQRGPLRINHKEIIGRVIMVIIMAMCGPNVRKCT